MADSIKVYVRPVRGTADNYGHVFFVYSKSDGTDTAVSLSPRAGTLGMFGGAANVDLGAWNANHPDWRRPGESGAQLLKTITADDLSVQWTKILQSYNDTASNKNYFATSQNSNAAGSAAANNAGIPVEWGRSNWSLPGLNYYQNSSETDDGGIHLISYHDGAGNTGLVKIDADGKLISETFSDVTHQKQISTGFGVDHQYWLDTLFQNGSKIHVDFDTLDNKSWWSLISRFDDLGRTLRVDTLRDDNSALVQHLNPSGTDLWVSRWVDFNADAQVVADIRDYSSISSQWLANHTFPTTNLWQADANFATELSASITRTAAHGGAIDYAAPNPIAYERQDDIFRLGSFDIDRNFALPGIASVRLVDPSGLGSSFDLSGSYFNGPRDFGIKVSFTPSKRLASCMTPTATTDSTPPMASGASCAYGSTPTATR